MIQPEGYTLYLKEPDKTVYEMFEDTYDVNPRKTKETSLNTLLIAEVSDMEALKDHKVYLTAVDRLTDIMALKKSTLEIL